MAQMTRKIHREVVKGTVADPALGKVRIVWEETITKAMRDGGYVPVLDLDSVFITEYNVEKDNYDCELVSYFMYLGKRKSWTTEGVSAGKTIPMYIHPTKSEPSSTPSASK